MTGRVAASLACWLLIASAAVAQLTAPERTQLVIAHNTVREDATPVPIPLLPAMAWNATLETTAQAYASGCIYQHSPGAMVGQYGENLYASTSSETPVPRPTPATVVSYWGSEKAAYNYAANSCSGVCGHYTQIVKRTATQVGCGIALCSAATSPFQPPFDQYSWNLYVCQYQTGQTADRPYYCDYNRDGAVTDVCDSRGIFVSGFETANLSRWSASSP